MFEVEIDQVILDLLWTIRRVTREMKEAPWLRRRQLADQIVPIRCTLRSTLMDSVGLVSDVIVFDMRWFCQTFDIWSDIILFVQAPGQDKG